MNTEDMNDDASRDACADILADLGASGVEADQLRTLLAEIAGLADEVPEPADDVRALLGGATPLRPRRRTVLVASTLGALVFGGVSAAAAANRLPDPVQEVVADATGGAVPHPIKPANRPYDAPGHDSRDDDSVPPGQIQKSTKPDPTAPGPARPDNPGSHGRAHHDASDSDNGKGKGRGKDRDD